MSYQFAEVNGTRIHYDIQGAGTAVIFIHAGIADLTMWEPQVAAFVKAGYRVIRYDLRGWGETLMPPGEFSDLADLQGLLRIWGWRKRPLLGVRLVEKRPLILPSAILK